MALGNHPNALGGGSSGRIAVQDEGSAVVSGANAVDFVGAGVVVTDGGNGKATVTISGGGSGVTVTDEGAAVNVATTLNFVGAGVTATDAGGNVATITIAGGGGGSSYTEVTAYSDLPTTLGTPAVGTVYLVKTSTGSWWNVFTKKPSGLYRRTGNAGALTDWTLLGDVAELTVDSTWGIQDQADGTKMMKFELGGFSTGREAIVTPPDQTAIAMVSTDATQTLTNKSIVATQLTGIIADARMPDLTGDVTTVEGAVATTIASGAVTLAKMANLAQDQFIGRTTASTGVPETATITAAARTVLDDATVAAMVDTLGGASSTGTGGLVRATSATLVTPDIGTPSAGVLTSCTGLPEAGLTLADNTTANASTSAHGLLLKATAPASGLVSYVGIGNGETVYANKALFDTTNAAAIGTAAPGTSLIAARRDHVHPLTLTGPVTTSAGVATTMVWEKQIACSDTTTAITQGNAKATFRMPFAGTLTAVRASVSTAPTGSTILIDINEGGVSVLSTRLMIDASEKTSTTAATPAVISDSALADDAEITIDFDQVGSSTAGVGVIVTLIGTRTA